MITEIHDDKDLSRFNMDLEQKLTLIKNPKCLGCQDVDCNTDNLIMDIDNFFS